VAYGAERIQSSVVFNEKLGNASSPTDIVFQDKDNWLLYSVNGKVIPYSNNKAGRPYQSRNLRGGICFVEIDKNFYFCDSQGGALRRLNSNYQVTATIESTTGNRKFNPTDVVKVRDDLYYIIDNNNHRIHSWNPQTGEFTNAWGEMGLGRGQLRFPFSAVVDNNRILYVTEVMNTRIQAFAINGRAVFTIGLWGVEPGQLFRPTGLALLHDRYLVVSDGYLGVLQIFDLYGNFVGVVTDERGNVRRYGVPTRIRAFDDLVAVLDYYEHTLEIISITGLK
jgi:hypothetical protein